MQALIAIGYAGIAFAVIAATAITFSVGGVNICAEVAGPIFVALEASQVRSELRRTGTLLSRPMPDTLTDA